MLFNSLQFLVFFPAVTILYFLLPHRWRWLHLIIASCVFYCAFIPVYIFILFFTIVIDYIAGIVIENAEGHQRKIFLLFSLTANIGVLAVFKYYNFFTANINSVLHFFGIVQHTFPLASLILPIGLSFHTFQAMSYTIEVYRGNQKAERQLGIYTLYVMFYPQLVAGPIERPQNLLHQFYEEHFFDAENLRSGLKLILWGMFKKVVIADRLAVLVNEVYDKPHDFLGFPLILATFFFAIQIYCDFSGYSDIAIGAARAMGFKLMTNFNAPYFSKSISEFWKRWHISLSTWFRDYLYISLGGNRVTKWRWYFNLFFVFLVSGFWHGANWNFVVWGALHGTYMVIGEATKNIRTKLMHSLGLFRFPAFSGLMQTLFTFVLVNIAWVFFRSSGFSDACWIISHFTCFGFTQHLHFSYVEIIFSLFLIGLLLLIENKKWTLPLSPNNWVFGLQFIGIGGLIYFFGVFSNSQFIYFQF